jgi:hypothetical protein
VAAVFTLSVWVAFDVTHDSPVDFSVYCMAGALARAGRSFYTTGNQAWTDTASALAITHFTRPHRYPPSTAALVSLLTPLGHFRAMIVWEVANALSLIAGAVMLGLTLGGRWRIGLAVATLVCFGPVYHSLLDGQVDGLAFLALTVAFWGLAVHLAAYPPGHDRLLGGRRSPLVDPRRPRHADHGSRRQPASLDVGDRLRRRLGALSRPVRAVRPYTPRLERRCGNRHRRAAWSADGAAAHGSRSALAHGPARPRGVVSADGGGTGNAAAEVSLPSAATRAARSRAAACSR